MTKTRWLVAATIAALLVITAWQPTRTAAQAQSADQKTQVASVATPSPPSAISVDSQKVATSYVVATNQVQVQYWAGVTSLVVNNQGDVCEEAMARQRVAGQQYIIDRSTTKTMANTNVVVVNRFTGASSTMRGAPNHSAGTPALKQSMQTTAMSPNSVYLAPRRE